MTDNSKICQSSLARAKDIATQALAGDVHLLLACRQISDEVVNLRGYADDVFDVFIGIDSECDGLPLGDERRYWEHSALVEEDKKIENYLAIVEPMLKSAMGKLISFL